MRSTRFLAFLLAFCMVFTAFAPAASAVAAPEMSVMNAEQNSTEKESATKVEASSKANGLIVSEDSAKDLPNKRENPQLQVEVETNDENSDKIDWSVKPAEGKPSVSLLPEKAPECLAELQKAAELYSVQDEVYAFVVMEGQALADTHTSRALVSAELEKQMIEKQDAVISSIERMVLGGEKLEVRYQFTYLTNAFTIKTAFGNLEKIAKMEGVKSVFLTPVFDPATVATPNTAASGAMTGVHNVWEDLGYTGTGMKIAIIDTGLDLDHPSFAADPETNANSLTTADIAAVLTDLNAYARRSTITAETLYRSAKIPYAFNYVDSSLSADHSRDMQGDHGTHVAGIAAANATEGTTVVGMAPDAQIIVMKVFGASGGAYMDDVAAALEDAMTLGCDVVNASLGSPRGFSSSDSEIDLIYERLASQDIIATFSAGNEGTSSYGNTWGTNMNRTQHPDNATIGSPSTWANTLSIASAENCEIQTPFFALADGTKVFFNNDSYSYYYGYTAGMAPLIGVELEYVMVDGLGYEEDFYDEEGNSLVEGKVALVNRGTIDFGRKIYNAELAGAAACIIVNNSDENCLDGFLFVDTVTDEEGNEFYPGIPSCMINMADGQLMAAAEVKTLTVSKDTAPRVVEGGQMSSFSSWGVTPDLQLMPDITGIGGNVYSCYDGGKYGLMSGTSMSAPQLAGISALVMQHLYTIYPDAPDGTIRELAEALLMSTADPIISNVSGAEVSPRQQGAGLVNAFEATTATTYLTVGGNRPKAELGDNANGNYTFSFEIHNIGDEDKTYTMSSSLMTEYVAGAYGQYFMYGEDVYLSGDVKFDKDSVTVPAGGRANVTVSISLSDDDKAYFAQAWKNGGYVEGYIYLVNEEGAYELNLPFLGFYGDWTKAPIFDTAYWYDNSFWGLNYATGLPEGDEYYNVIWTDLGGQDWVLGMNAYSGALVDQNGNIYYDPANNVLSPNGDGVLDGIAEIYLSLMRNAKTLTFTYTVDGEVMHKEVITGNPKTMYISAYGQIVPWIYSWYGWDMYDFTGKDGKVLPSGTEVLLTIDGYIDYGTGGDHSIQIPITVDTEAPELVDVYELPQQNGDHYLFVELSENIAPAAVVLMNPAGTQILAQDYFFQETADGTYLIGFDITDMGTEFMVALCDYACNEAYYDIKYSAAADGNLPEVDTSVIYGYRVHDDHLMSDHMYGWVSTNKPVNGEYANISVLTDDYLEYAAITAAEYAGGKVFAFDAVYNFLVMDPGLWNRTTICNIGMSVLDMAFDDVTDTMYLVAKDDWSESYLYSIDLLTGELTELCYFGYYNYGPWAITFDNEGTLYAIKVGSSNLYTVDIATGDMTPVTDAEGNTFVMTLEDGTKIAPTAYSQSITYSEEDNTIYWAHFKYSWWGSSSGMAAVNLTDLTTTYSSYAAQAYSGGSLVDYYPQTEIVGLMVLEETDYTLPEASELNAITLDAESLVMSVGESAKLTASANPWNYELGQVTWTSSDDAVASVADGKVTANGEGTAVITASVGDLTAECTVSVISIGGNFYAYNFYSGDGNYGYMIDVDMATMDYSLVAAPGADFITGDYNGHEGVFYGYTENGQFWSYDFNTDVTTALGAPVTSIPTDMAYDYSTGLLYAVTLDTMSGYTALNVVNMTNGAMEPVAYMYYNFLLTLACDLEGNLYGIDYAGNVMKLYVNDGMMEGEPLIYEMGSLNYAQSMCYDFNNDVLIWGYPEMSIVYWIDVKADEPYAVALGDPTESGFEFVGMFTVPAEIPELAYVPVESASAEDMTMLVGTTKFPNLAVLPFNATVKSAELTSDNASVVKVNEDGSLTAVAEGVATVTGQLIDGENTFDISFTVNVIQGADDIYGYVMIDLATYGGQYWIRMYPQDTAKPDEMEIIEYIIYAEEYYNGDLYAVGYDANDYSGNWQMLILDPVNHAIKDKWDLGMEYPFIYDMTYDYATSTMYCVAGPSDTASDLYVMDMETGAVTLLMETEQFFMSLAATPDGTLYAMEPSEQAVIGFDDWGWEIYGYTNAMLYAIDPIEATIELVGDTGMKCNMLASMAYDYDTDRLYWTPMFQGDSLVSGLAIVDPETGKATNLGTIGGAGAQVSGLYILSDNMPEEKEPALYSMLVNPVKTVVNAGNTVALNAVTLPMNLDAEIVWKSSDIEVATVDENGVVTGVSQGKAEIIATVTYNGVTMTDSCTVAVLAEDASFLTYNLTDGGWSAVSRSDATVVTNLTEGEEIAVQAIASAGDKVYGYDVDNNLFSLNTETYERTILGAIDAEEHITAYLELFGYSEEEIAEQLPMYAFEVRDMAYDAANDRYVILGNVYDAEWGEVNMGNAFYEVNLEDGTLTLLHTIEDLYNVMAMTVDADGYIYYYCAYNDSYTKLDLATGETKVLSSVYTLGYYGSTDHDHALYFDDLTGLIYHAFTSNGTFYRLLTLDPASGTISLESEYIGEAFYDYNSWRYVADAFAGLAFVAEDAGNQMPEDPLPPVYLVDWVSGSTTLDGTINLNFYVKLSANIVNDPTAFVRFTYAGNTVDVPMAEAVVSEVNGVVRYRFGCELYAKQMADTVTAQVMNENGPIGEAKSYSVMQYCLNKIAANESEEMVALAKAMLNYGAAAQVLFGYNTENLANASLSAEDKALADVDASAYKYSITGSEAGIKAKSATLMLESEVAVRVYFKLEEGADIASYTFTVNGEEVAVQQNEKGYYIESAGIAAKDLDEMLEFSVGGLTVTYGALSYVNSKAASSNADEANMAKALFAYYSAAESYFG